MRWGILSTANIGRKVVTPAIQASKNAEVIAVASRTVESARSYAADLDIPSYYGDYDALLTDERVDAVYIPLPNSLHYEWTCKALAAGKHVLCEKPLGLSAEECLAMQRLAAQQQRVLMEAFMYRFHPRIAVVQDLLETNVLGAVTLLRSAFTFKVTQPENIRLQAELGGGALMDVGCYCVNLSRTLMGSEPVRAQAFAVWSSTGVDEALSGVLEFSGQRYAQFYCALNAARHETVEVLGTEGSLQLAAAFLPGTLKTSITVAGKTTESRTIPAGTNQYIEMVEHFSHCVSSGQQPRYGALEAAANMATIEALYASARDRGVPTAVTHLN